jgi:MATE family multidrug resistance protein
VRAIAHLGAPIAVAQLLLVAIHLVDTAVVGRGGVTDLAAVSIARSVQFAAQTIGMGIATAIEPLAAQAIGAGETGRAFEARTMAKRACLLWWLPSVGLSLSVTFAFPYFGIEAEVARRAQGWILAAAPAQLFFNWFMCDKTFLQARGTTRPAVIGSVLANVVNAAVCPVLVLGDGALARVGIGPFGLLPLGAVGAGVAASVSTFFLWWTLGPAVRALREPEAERPVRLAEVLRLGLPMGLQTLAEISVFTVVSLMAGRFGASTVSAHQVALGLASFTFMGALGVSGATAVRVGYAVGEGRSALVAGTAGLALGAAVMSVGAVAFASAPRLLVGIFSTDPNVVELGVSLLAIAAVFQLVDGMQCVAAGALRGAGDVRAPLLANVLAHWAVGFPAATLLGWVLGYGARGLWWGLTAGLVAAAVVLTTRFVRIARRPIARV